MNTGNLTSQLVSRSELADKNDFTT